MKQKPTKPRIYRNLGKNAWNIDLPNGNTVCGLRSFEYAFHTFVQIMETGRAQHT